MKKVIISARSQVKRKALDLTQDYRSVRQWLSHRFLRGEGVEIGALHLPLYVPPGTKVTYVDRMSLKDLRTQYPELEKLDLTPVDVVENGETLESFRDGSLSFVVANHFMEHTEDPIRTIKNHLRVLRDDGILYYAIPDRRYTFDIDREPTGLQHLAEDHAKGAERSRKQHFEEWVEHVEKVEKPKRAERVKYLLKIDYSIHFHVWTPLEFAAFLYFLEQEEKLPISLEALVSNEHEFIAIIRKVGKNSDTAKSPHAAVAQEGPKS
jgi:predicted SAM-dependent methyltransferase